MHLQKLDSIGVSVTGDAIKQAADVIGRLTAEDRNHVAGMYFVRQHAAIWFLSDRKNYFA